MDQDAPSNAILNIHLIQLPGASEFDVDRTELLSDTIRHRITASSPDRRLISVFCQDFAEFLQGLLQKQSERMMVFTDSSISFETQAMGLACIQILATMNSESAQKVTIRFTRVTGNIQDIFRKSQTSMRIEPRKIAIEALERVVSRTYDATRVSAMVDGLEERKRLFSDSSEQIQAKRDELQFRLDLLRLAVATGWNNQDQTDDIVRPALRVV